MRASCLPSTTVTVTVNGRALQELQQTQVDGGADKGASAFIESPAGAAFAVELDLEAGLAVYEGSIEFAIYLDVKSMGGSVVDLRNGKQNAKLAGVHESSDEGTGFRRFTFARHEMTDGNSDPRLNERLERLGEVKAILRRCRVMSVMNRPTYGQEFRGVGEQQIPRQALQGRSISNHVKIGELEQVNRSFLTCEVTYPFKRKHLASYVFSYRSHKDLQNEGIIESSPSPVGADIKQQSRIKTQKRHRSATIVLSSDDEGGDVIVAGIKRLRIADREVIDLTDD